MEHIQIDKNLYIRLLTARDAESLFTLTIDSKDYLKKWLPWLDTIQEENDSLNFIKNQLLAFEEQTGITFGIFANDNLVGVISYNTIDHANKTGEIGYWIGKNYQGNGYITKATKALIDYGFDKLQLNRIVIQCATGNIPSQKIPEKLHFTKEGILREAGILYDSYVDHIVYSLLRSERDKLSTEK